jgi:hypothetical protein
MAAKLPAWPHTFVIERVDTVLPDDQCLVRSGTAPCDENGRKPSVTLHLSWSAPNHSTVCGRQKTLTVRIPYQPALLGVTPAGRAHRPVGDARRQMEELEVRRKVPRQWRRLHIVIDAPVLSSLLAQIDPHEAEVSVKGDGV